MTISSLVSRATAITLAVGGGVMLFGADSALPIAIPNFPANALFLGQIIAGAWLAMAAMNWQYRTQTLGGIYGRPIVYANLVMFTVTALGVLRAATATATATSASAWLWVIVGTSGLLALIYALLMFRGPFERLNSAN